MSQSFAWPVLIGFCLVGAVAFARTSLTQGRGFTRSTGAAPRRNTWTDVDPAQSPLHEPWAAPSESIRQEAASSDRFESWSLDVLHAIEWKRFELLCAKYYEAVGFKSETLRCGADGGIDVKLFKIDPTKPMAVVQCKAWNTTQVGVKEIRELLGVMAHEKVSRGIFITTSRYTKDAVEFAAANPIQLIDGQGFLGKIQALPDEAKAALLGFAMEGDYRTPTCPSCGIKMTTRNSRRGPFWGCIHYPRCRSTIPFSG